ncbi:nucleoside-diphosphate sugar epimerase [Microbacterium mangrovi]|uniref:Nucleoside-diphosphate sugar epimerase n=1 Tax=Microbacterium mangrovi TaxID=1348253 RepID=A0A0B2A5E0_9MICO|nr:TIGR01777 family oxidoreductase [Microbacterium mangrovi]KHK98724.1 nucleoside-diphosphate sugar epimerase [Microbacterium mangrovi]
MSTDRIVVSGASGLIGSALVASLRADGVPVTTLVRRAPRAADEVEWAPGAEELDPAVLAGARAVVGLNGASVGRLPWTPRYRELLRSSRIDPTRTLATAIRGLGPDAPMLVSASAVGYYGDRPGARLTEASGAGTTFLARLSAAWEAEAALTGERVALLRTAPLMDRDGMLKPLITLTQWGVSGPVGTGRQIWPWISLADEVRGIRHIIDRGLTGPVNLAGPQATTAFEIGHELAHRLHRPFVVPAPSWALRIALGPGAADSLLLPDAHVVPDVLTRSGFAFTHATAASAIAEALSD